MERNKGQKKDREIKREKKKKKEKDGQIQRGLKSETKKERNKERDGQIQSGLERETEKRERWRDSEMRIERDLER